MNKHFRINKYLFILSVLILVVSLSLSSCGGGAVIEEEEPPIVTMHPSFSFSDLVIEPNRVTCGEEVTITVSITNIGENQERYESLLNINGIEEEIKSITLEPGTTGILTYNVARDVSGTYDVEMSGLTGSFTVQPSEAVISEDDTGEEDITETPALTKITTSGHITSDETWSGTVHITGEIFIDEGIKVTILPGTTVLFAAHKDDQQFGASVNLDEWIESVNDPTGSLEYAESHIAIRGTLIASGTPEERITFTSDSPTPDGGDWVHLHVGSGSIIEYCIIEYSKGGVDVMPGTGDSVIISHNIMRHNLWCGITVHSSASTITYNEIYDSGGHQGICVEGEGSAPSIKNNMLRHNKVGVVILPDTFAIVEDNILIDNDNGISIQSSAIIRNNSISSPNGAPEDFTYQGVSIYPASSVHDRYDEIEGITIINASPNVTGNEIFDYPRCIGVIGNSSPVITYNTITGGSGGGILFSANFSGEPKINYNNIYDNGANIGLQPGFKGTIDASNNWWGTTDKLEIEGKIADSRHDTSLGTVIYEPFQEEPIDID